MLDLYKSITKDWSSFFNFIASLWDAHRRIEIDRTLIAETIHPSEVSELQNETYEPVRRQGFPWRSLLAFLLALYAQLALEPPGRVTNLAVPVYVFAGLLAIWAFLQQEWQLPGLPAARQYPEPLSVRLLPMIASIPLALIAFWDFNRVEKFTAINFAFWILALISLILGLWLRHEKNHQASDGTKRNWIWITTLLAILGLAIFFRLNRIGEVPAEPFSDHAEKILDIYDITQGHTNIFFPRNTGREAFQMYWTLLIANLFGTGLSFLSLKLGTALLGLFTLPYIYLLGREFGGARTGALALLLFGIGYWPNLISRIGLRFPLYPLFTAPSLYHLLRGLRTRARNDFILCGVFLGLGLHGYSPFRIVPLLVLIAFGLTILHAQSRDARQQAAWWLVIILVVSLYIFLPLLSYASSHPDVFFQRAFSRLAGIEAPLTGPVGQIFFSNLWRGMLMFNWDDGEIWVNSVPHRPALDVVTGALFVLGMVLLIVRYVRGRDWRDLFLFLSIPVLLMPSVLSLAFPGENPALNRAAAAAIPTILISALALDGFLRAFQVPESNESFQRGGLRSIMPWILIGLALAGSAYQNYDLVFHQYDQQFRAGAWNSSEMGKVINDFRAEYGHTDTVWIVPYPHWVDTRLPGVWAGIPNRDFAMWPDNLSDTLNKPYPKLFIFNLENLETENALRELYPQGLMSRYTSATPGKDFNLFFIEK